MRSAMSDPQVLQAIRDSAVFGELPAHVTAALAGAMRPVPLPAGEVLFARAEDACALYLLVEGELQARERRVADAEAATVRTVGPGEAVDELMALAGAAHPVEVRAATDSLALAADGDAVDALCAAHPGLAAARERLHRRQLLCRLHPVVGPFDRALMDEVERSADWRHLPRGRMLVEQNNPADAVYVVVSGRVQVSRVAPDGTARILGEAGRGETTGEAAFFAGRARDERVTAIRDSVLVGFTAEEIESLIARRPRMLRQVLRTVVERAYRAQGPAGRGTVTNVAVLPVGDGAPLDAFCDRLAAALGRMGPVLRLTAAGVDATMQEPGISQAWAEDGETARLLAWLEGQEAAHRFVVYQADATATPWTRRCLRQADRAVWVAPVHAGPAPTELEHALAATEGRGTDTHDVLVLVHPNGDGIPSGTRAWLDARHVEEHVHLRWNRDADFGRLARMLAGEAVGVVLGGGGARGLAHLGVLRALEEAGIPVDAIGGTSMGAALAAQYALGWSVDRVAERNRWMWLTVKPHRKFSLPVLSLVGSSRADRCGRELYAEVEMEDLWTPCFCVSSNITTAEMVVHRTGPVMRATRASTAIPAFAIPVLGDDGLLVDGAVLNNLPVDVMREVMGCGTVIAAEVSVEEDAAFACDRIPTTWEVLRGRWFRGPKVKFPSLMEVAMRSSMLHSIHREKTTIRDADFCLRAPIDGFSLMDFARMDEIMDVGYRYAREALAAWAPPPSTGIRATGAAAAGGHAAERQAAEAAGTGR